MSQIPATLAKAIAETTRDQNASGRTAATARMTSTYRDTRQNLRLGEAEKLAYLVARLPATYVVAARVLEELTAAAPDFQPASLLDAGAGPGTASWAALEAFPDLKQVTMAEHDAGWIALSRKLAATAQEPLKNAVTLHRDLSSAEPLPAADLIVAGYALNELSREALSATTTRLWQATKGALVLIEPGSRQGFETVRAVRDVLLAHGAILAAPCPHAHTCPMTGDDWCHFRQTVQRTAAHRQAKAGTLGHETEKFSYLIAARPGVLPETINPAARIIAAPMRRSGHITLDLCTSNATLDRATISRRHGDQFRAARDVEWGDVWSGE